MSKDIQEIKLAFLYQHDENNQALQIMHKRLGHCRRMCQVETVLAEFGTSQRFLIPCLNNGIYLVKFA
jgi:hypothetical protein